MSASLEDILERFASGNASVDELEEELLEIVDRDPDLAEIADQRVKMLFMEGKLSAPTSYRLREMLGGFSEDTAEEAESETNEQATDNTATDAILSDAPEDDATIVPLPPEESSGDNSADDSDWRDWPDSSDVTVQRDRQQLPGQASSDLQHRQEPGDGTVIRSSAGGEQGAPVDDATRIRALTDGNDDPGIVNSTEVKPQEDITRDYADKQNRDHPVVQSLAPAHKESNLGTGTGSNWAHPEQWSELHEGSVAPGDSLGRFYIESVLGQGGMGVVFKARDRLKEEAQDRNPYVAMKVLSEDFRNHPQSFIALAREWKKAAGLSHENIITVHDFDRVGSTVFMTMELLDGEPLDALIRKHALRGLPKERAEKIVDGCARALAFAHSKGIVHSDFKPGNVFVMPNDEVKVLDFGIARAVPTAIQPVTDKTVFDATNLGALTPTYASAEMLDGKPPTAACDVYALAIVAYELYSGRHPFERTPADEARKQGLKPPSLTGPSRRQRGTIMRGLSLDATQRQADAGEFYRQWRGLQLPKWVYAAITASLLVAVFFGVRSLQESGPEQPFESLSEAEQQQFAELMADGRQNLSDAEESGVTAFYDAAITQFSKAYEIHPRNPDAVVGLRDTAERWIESLDGLDESSRSRRLEQGLDKFVCQDYLNSFRPIEEACLATFGIDQCSLEGPTCASFR